MIRVATLNVVFEIWLGEDDVVHVTLRQCDAEHRERDPGQLAVCESIQNRVTRLVIGGQVARSAAVMIDLEDDLCLVVGRFDEPV